MVYDVAVIGAGPSGSTLARLLSKDFKVLLVEKRPFSGTIIEKEKYCGGLLAPDAQRMLARLGLGLPKEILSSPQLFSVRAIDFDSGLTRDYQRHYINMDREKFDSWLINIIPENSDLIFNASLKGITETSGGFVIKVLENNVIKSYESRIVVGADGADSKVRKLTYKGKDSIRSYIAVQEWYRSGGNIDPCFYSVFDSEVTDFYSWIIIKDENIILGTALEPEKVTEKFNILKEKISEYGMDLSSPFKKNGAKLLRPGLFRSMCPGKKGIVLTGEAAGLISPSSAEGLSYAMESSMILAGAIKDNPSDFSEIYFKRLRKMRRKLFMKGLKSMVMYNKALRKLILKAGVSAIK